MQRSKRRRVGAVQKKILFLLLSGAALGCTRSSKKHWRIIKGIPEEFRNIDKRAAERAIKLLYESNLIEQKSNRDGTITFELSKDGEKLALTYNIDEMEIPKQEWDGKWRIVIFDIPERLKKVRDTFRFQMNRLGFKELQKSVFVLPYECRNEIEFITEFYNIRRYLRYIEATSIDNQLDLELQFKLS